MTDINDARGDSAPAFKFEQPGATVKGRIVSINERQQFKIGGTEPATWEDGNPKMQYVITLATDVRSHEIEDDDGHRRIFAPKPSAILRAILDAREAAGRGVRLEAGGVLAVRFTGLGEPKKKGFSPPKQYKAKYEPGSSINGSDDEL
jgi:hypothetical protein